MGARTAARMAGSSGEVGFLVYFKGRAKGIAHDFFLSTKLWGPSEEGTQGSEVTWEAHWGPHLKASVILASLAKPRNDLGVP